MILTFISIDIEPTNRCNAKCHFCPRDQTPHQGLMTPETFRQALDRVIDFAPIARDQLERELKVSLCGLGEPLLNKHTPSFVRAVTEAGFPCAMASNGALLTEAAGAELLDAGLKSIQINVGEQGDDYEAVYKLPWERTFENVVRFNEMAEGRCHTQIVLVNHRPEGGHAETMTEFWRSHGLQEFVEFDLINRGGALEVDHMQYETYAEQEHASQLLGRGRTQPVVCGAPFSLPFVGYDGNYYLCCSDWRKQAPMGSVFERSIVDVTADKLQHVTDRDAVCKSCNHDPLNRVTEELRLLSAGRGSEEELATVLADSLESDAVVRQMTAALGVPDPAVRPRRASIPVRVTT